MNDNIVLKSILLISANPKGTLNLRLQEEEREIRERLRLAGYGKVPINSVGAARPRDIQQAMVDFKPRVVHFSGHGAGQDGLVFEDVSGQLKLVDSEALANLFKLFSDCVECVILNACYSKFQAEAIAQHINYVIGMSQSIGDLAAIEFAAGFYTALGSEEEVEFAYELGCNAIQLAGISEHLTPVLHRKTAGKNPLGYLPCGKRTKLHDLILNEATLIVEKTTGFVGRQFIFDAITNFTDSNSCGYFILKGVPGIGKSSLAAQLVKTGGYAHHFNSRGEGSSTPKRFLENICAQLIVGYQLGYDDLPSNATDDSGFLKKILNEVSDKLGFDEKAIIVVDALDEVDGRTGGANILYMPKSSSTQVCVE